MSDANPNEQQNVSGPSTEGLLELVYNDLRSLAASKLACELPGKTLQATALVHDAWMKPYNEEPRIWQNHAQFFATAAEAMCRTFNDQARKKRKGHAK